MQIAIYDATNKVLDYADDELQVQNYWRALEGDEKVYTLTDFAFVDDELLAEYEHEQFIEDGWEVLQ